jgi:hypothetical protein
VGSVGDSCDNALAVAVQRCPTGSPRALLLEHAQEWAAGFAKARADESSKRDRERVAEAADRVELAAAQWQRRVS